jgi:hypothetical protein
MQQARITLNAKQSWNGVLKLDRRSKAATRLWKALPVYQEG